MVYRICVSFSNVAAIFAAFYWNRYALEGHIAQARMFAFFHLDFPMVVGRDCFDKALLMMKLHVDMSILGV